MKPVIQIILFVFLIAWMIMYYIFRGDEAIIISNIYLAAMLIVTAIKDKDKN